MPRELREIVWIEVVAVLAIAIAPWPDTIPVALPLLVAGTLSRWVRRRAWADVSRGSRLYVGVGALAGLAALVVAAFAASHGMAALSGRSVEWSEHAVVRGNVQLVLIVSVYVAITALAAELALRGWIVERVLELSPGSPVLPVIIGGIAEMLVTPGDLGMRLGAGLFGCGLGWMYVASGRSVVAPVCARIAFQVGAVALEALRLVG